MEAKGKVNFYGCVDCGNGIYTITLANGVTPMFVTCKKCKGTMHSAMYQISRRIYLTIDLAWIRPTKERFQQMDISHQYHIMNGGLLLEPIGTEMAPDFLEGKDNKEAIEALQTYYGVLKDDF